VRACLGKRGPDRPWTMPVVSYEEFGAWIDRKAIE